MSGRKEIADSKAKLDAVFKRAKQLEDSANTVSLETRADMARYLCVLVSGYLERAVAEMLMQHSRNVGGPTLQRFVERSTGNFTNAKCKKLMALFESFDPAWKLELEKILIDEVKDAVDSVVSIRHLIAHGRSVGITYARMTAYYKHINVVVDYIINMCDPKS